MAVAAEVNRATEPLANQARNSAHQDDRDSGKACTARGLAQRKTAPILFLHSVVSGGMRRLAKAASEVKISLVFSYL